MDEARRQHQPRVHLKVLGGKDMYRDSHNESAQHSIEEKLYDATNHAACGYDETPH